MRAARHNPPSRAQWIGGIAAAVLVVGAGIAYASSGGATPASAAKGSGPTAPPKLTLVNGLLAVETMLPSGSPQTLVAPTGGKITGAAVDAVLFGSLVPVVLSVSSDGTFLTLTPNGSSPSMAVVQVNYTDASGFAGNVCTIVVIVGTVPTLPLTLVDGALSLQQMSKTGMPLTVAAPVGGKVTNAVVDSGTAGHVPVLVTTATDEASVTISPNGLGPSTAVIKVTYTDATGFADNVCTIVVSVT